LLWCKLSGTQGILSDCFFLALDLTIGQIKAAEEAGAAGVLIYSDPRDDNDVTVENGYLAYILYIPSRLLSFTLHSTAILSALLAIPALFNVARYSTSLATLATPPHPVILHTPTLPERKGRISQKFQVCLYLGQTPRNCFKSSQVDGKETWFGLSIMVRVYMFQLEKLC
jgi:hypothetical protein